MLNSSRSTRLSTRTRWLASERRARRAQILRDRRAAQSPSTHENSNSAHRLASERRARRAQILRDRRAANLTGNDETSTSNEVNMVQQHFNRMRNRSRRLPSPNDMSEDEPDVSGSEDEDNISPSGIQEFDSPTLSLPSDPYTLLYPDLADERNYTCPYCNSILWKEERQCRFNCCNSGKYTIPALKPVPSNLMAIFTSKHFQKAQRAYNGLFSFTALGAGGIEKKTWTHPRQGQSMLTLHGKSFHRLFDLSQHYPDMNVSNSSRFYIFDSEFHNNCSSLKLQTEVANTLRTHIHQNVRWAREYRSAVDQVLNSSGISDSNSPTPYIEFADVSRVNDGPEVGEQISAPEIAALVYTSGQQNSGTRAVVTYPVNSPDDKPRLLPLWSSTYETLQFPLLFFHGESGWSKGNAKETPPYSSKTMNRTGTSHVPFPFYCRQRILSEPLFKTNSRVAQEWACDSLSRLEEDKLSFIGFGPLQQRLASDRSIRAASSGSRKNFASVFPRFCSETKI